MNLLSNINQHQFSPISNNEISAYSTKHPRDVGEELKKMLLKGWLVSEGKGRGTKYRLKRNISEGGQVHIDNRNLFNYLYRNNKLIIIFQNYGINIIVLQKL